MHCINASLIFLQEVEPEAFSFLNFQLNFDFFVASVVLKFDIICLPSGKVIKQTHSWYNHDYDNNHNFHYYHDYHFNNNNNNHNDNNN